SPMRKATLLSFSAARGERQGPASSPPRRSSGHPFAPSQEHRLGERPRLLPRLDSVPAPDRRPLRPLHRGEVSWRRDAGNGSRGSPLREDGGGRETIAPPRRSRRSPAPSLPPTRGGGRSSIGPCRSTRLPAAARAPAGGRR